MSYFREFRVNWKALLAASIGMGSGYTINNYFNNIFIPPLMQEFGWDSSGIALIGSAAMLSVVFQPLAGRLTDRFGVRRVALFGIVAAAVIYVLLSMMTGALWQYLVLTCFQIALVASTTGPVVYSRLVAQTFDRARGLSLATAVCAPSIAGAAIVPGLTRFIEDHGWRAGYQLSAACLLVAGLVGLAMISPRLSRPVESSAGQGEQGDMFALLRGPAFKLILGGMILCSLSISLQTTQLKVLVQNAGFDSAEASSLISIYALGVIAGRFASGAALDTMPTHVVAAIAMALPGVGLLLLASGSASLGLTIVAMLCLGVSLGAEGDIAGYLVMQYFPLPVYSSVLGLVIGSISLAAGFGGLLLSATLSVSGEFVPFVAGTGVAALVGGFLFWRLGQVPVSGIRAAAAG